MVWITRKYCRSTASVRRRAIGLSSPIKIELEKIIFNFNGGPDKKHKYLRHIEIGGGMGSSPIVKDDGQEPVGSRLTLVFDKYVPEMTPTSDALIQPVMDFNVKTPLEAYVDTCHRSSKRPS